MSETFQGDYIGADAERVRRIIHRQEAEIERLRAALRKIAERDYSDKDKQLTWSSHKMIWELVALRALLRCDVRRALEGKDD